MSESVEPTESEPAPDRAVVEQIEELVGRFYTLQPVESRVARTVIEEAVALAEDLGDPALLARTLCAYAQSERHFANNNAALEKLSRARDLYASIGDLGGQGYAIGLIGTVYKSLGDSRSALRQQLQALELYERSGDLSEKGGVLNDLGNAYKTLGDFTMALECHLQSLDIAIDIKSRKGEASALNNIGNIYYELADLPTAIDYYLRSLEIKEELGDPTGLGNSLGNLGLVYGALGDFDQAVEYHSRSLHCFRQCGNREGETNSVGNLANLWCAHGSAELALQYGSEGLALAREICDREAESDTLRTIGNAHRLQGENAAAAATLEEALAIAIEIEARPLAQKIHHTLSEALRDLGDGAGAYEHLKRMYAIREEIASANARRTIGNRVLLYDLESARKEAEIERLKNVELAQAFRDLEAAQARLVHAEKMAYIGHLTAGVTDQARHPLAAIDSALGPLASAAREIVALGRSLFEDNCSAAPGPAGKGEEIAAICRTIDSGLATIEEEATRTAAIVEGLRSFTRLDEGSLKPAILHDGISALLTLVRNRCRGRISIIFNAGSIPPVECYPGLINQAVLAIVSEAIDRIAGRGEIVIATDSFGSIVTMTITSRNRDSHQPAAGAGAASEPTGSLAVTVAREILEKHHGELMVETLHNGDIETRLVLPVRQPDRRHRTTEGV